MKGFFIADERVGLGERKSIQLSLPSLYDSTSVHIPIEVLRGKKKGPVLFLCAAIHGDEINGVEIIRRLLQKKKLLSQLKGTLIAAPLVNVYGFNNRSRYLPDRRDLNRCFPGSRQGSLASRIAYLIGKEVLSKATHCIDLHTGATHRKNYPQIRACLDDRQTKLLAKKFGVPVILNAGVRDGSLRGMALSKGIPVLVYEGGEALRFDELSLRYGLQGVINVMKAIGMLPSEPVKKKKAKTKSKKIIHMAEDSHWVRSPASGLLLMRADLGEMVKKGEEIAFITDPNGTSKTRLLSPFNGMIICTSEVPLVTQGDAIIHIATFDKIEEAPATGEEIISPI